MQGQQRVQYVRVCGERCAYVILDVGPGGAETFAEQEPWEVRWWSFIPTAEEREFALRLLRDGKGKGWHEVLVIPAV